MTTSPRRWRIRVWLGDVVIADDPDIDEHHLESRLDALWRTFTRRRITVEPI